MCRRALLVANSAGGDILAFDLVTAEFMFSAGGCGDGCGCGGCGDDVIGHLASHSSPLVLLNGETLDTPISLYPISDTEVLAPLKRLPLPHKQFHVYLLASSLPPSL